MAVSGCCFGGPMDGQIVANDSTVLLVLIPPSEPVSYWEPSPIAVSWSERTYTSKRLRFAHIEWTPWLYNGPWVTGTTARSPEEYVRQGVQMMWEMASAWNGRPVDAEYRL